MAERKQEQDQKVKERIEEAKRKRAESRIGNNVQEVASLDGVITEKGKHSKSDGKDRKRHEHKEEKNRSDGTREKSDREKSRQKGHESNDRTNRSESSERQHKDHTSDRRERKERDKPKLEDKDRSSSGRNDKGSLKKEDDFDFTIY